MAKALFTVFFNVILSIASLITAPVNAIITNDFPDFANHLTNFGNLLNQFISNQAIWFFHILPSPILSYLNWILDSLIILITISISAHTIIKVIGLIKRVKVV